MKKEFTVKCVIGLVFQSREQAYDFLEKWRVFIDECVPVEAHDYHDISLNSRVFDEDSWCK